MEVVNAFNDMDIWFETLAGKYVQQEICASLKTVPFTSTHGAMLQIGSCGTNPWLNQMQYDHKWILTPSIAPQTNVLGLPDQLPFIKESIQMIFLPFLFDLVNEDVLAIVNEVDRVLESMGYISILGMNPSGLWKFSRLFKYKKNLSWYQMTTGNSYWKMKSLFKSMGYEQIDAQFFYYIPPIQSKTALNYFVWVNRISKLIAFYPPAFFLLTLQKKQPSLILPDLVKSTFW